MTTSDKNSAVTSALEPAFLALGYTRHGKDSFRKKGRRDYDFQIKLIIEDSILLDFTILIGVFSKKIEDFLINSSMRKSFLAQHRLNFPTIFWNSGRFAGEKKSLNQKVFSISNMECNILYINEAVKNLENKIQSMDDVATLLSEDFHLPIGHHAFRVPLVFYGKKYSSDQIKYINYVKSLGLIPIFDKFVEEIMPLYSA